MKGFQKILTTVAKTKIANTSFINNSDKFRLIDNNFCKFRSYLFGNKFHRSI